MSLKGRDMVMVALRDRVIRRPIINMYILEHRFREMNWQAIPSGLGPAGLKPSRRKSRALTKTLLGKREKWMRILEPVKTCDAELRITLELRRENEDEMNSLQDLLIAMGCAQHTDAKIVPAIPGIQ